MPEDDALPVLEKLVNQYGKVNSRMEWSCIVKEAQMVSAACWQETLKPLEAQVAKAVTLSQQWEWLQHVYDGCCVQVVGSPPALVLCSSHKDV